jgi:DNA-binding NarL/FixJ family response regulator
VLEVIGQSRARSGQRALPGGLTSREVEVLSLIAHGASNRDVATRLIISPKTARNHVQNVYAKIGVSTRAAATVFALQHGLIDAAL